MAAMEVDRQEITSTIDVTVKVRGGIFGFMSWRKHVGLGLMRVGVRILGMNYIEEIHVE